MPTAAWITSARVNTRLLAPLLRSSRLGRLLAAVRLVAQDDAAVGQRAGIEEFEVQAI